MAGAISPQPLAVGEMSQNKEERLPKQSYADQLRSKETIATSSTKLNLCPITVIHGEPTIEFTMDEVNEFTREEGLHQAAVLKFSYGKPDLQEIRRMFSTQFDVSGNCNIGQLEYRHLLVRFDLFSDYVQFISKSTGYLKSKGEEYFFRTFPWTLRFNPKEETSMAVVWISMPGLPPNFFAKRSIMSIASAVGKALAVDKATQERTRPSTARVKVLLDLLDERPKKVKLHIVDKSTGKSVSYYQEIVYDNLPSYCCYCKHQGHDERACRILKEKSRKTMDATVGQNSNNLSIVDKSSVEQLKGSDLNVHNVVNLERLQGDARDFLNAKRAEQNGMEKQAKDGQQHDNNTRQQLRQVYNINVEAIGIAANDPKDSTAGTVATLTTADNKASGKTVAAPVQGHVDRNDIRTMSKADIPASTVFARMNKGIGHANNVTTDHLKTVEAPSYVPVLQSEEQLLLNNNNRKPALHEVSKDLCKVDKENGGNKTKKGEAWTVVTSRKAPVTKEPAAVQLDTNSRRSSSGKVLSSSNKFDVLEQDNVEQLELAISNEGTMSKHLIQRDEKVRDAQGSGIEEKNWTAQEEFEEHSSNVPTIHFSSPHIEHIIKDAQDAMMRHTNMGRQPIVTLNTSVLEIPSQSEKSIEEQEGHYTQLINSTKMMEASNIARLKENTTILKQGEGQNESENEDEDSECESGQIQSDSEEEDDGYDEANEEDSSEQDTCGSEDEELLSVGSPSGVRTIECSKLNAEAPALVPTAERQQIERNTTNTSQINQQQQSIVVVQEKSNDEDNLAGTGNKEMEQKQQEVDADRKAIGTNSNGMQQSSTGQTKPNVGQQHIVQTTASSSARNQPRRGMPRFRNTYRSGEVPIQCDTLEMTNEYITRVSEETTVRQLPMRVAKQKQVVSNTSNRYKK